MIKQPTSLNIDSTLWKEVKIEAIRRGITLTELVEYALRKELHTNDQIKAREIETKSSGREFAMPMRSSDKTSQRSTTKYNTSTTSPSDSHSNNIPTISAADIAKSSGFSPMSSLTAGLKDIAKSTDGGNLNQVIETMDTFKNQLLATISGRTFSPNQSFEIRSVKKRE